MAEAKKNKDGLIGGSLVSQKDHDRIVREKQKAKREAAQKK
mgnify:CR=1 FL=1